MKKLLLILFPLFLFLNVNAQLTSKTYKWEGTITLTASENDTIYDFAVLGEDFVMGVPFSLAIEYSGINVTDVQLGILEGNFPGCYSFHAIDTTDMITLDNIAYRDERNVARQVDNIMEPDGFQFSILGLKVVTATAATGSIKYRWLQTVYYVKK